MIKSKSWGAIMCYWVCNESLWTMITLFILWFKGSSGRTGNTSFTIPKRFILRTLTLIVKEYFPSRAFTCFCGWIDASWGGTVTFTWLSARTEFSAFRTSFTLLGNWIKELSSWWIAFDTICSNFIIAFTTF